MTPCTDQDQRIMLATNNRIPKLQLWLVDFGLSLTILVSEISGILVERNHKLKGTNKYTVDIYQITNRQIHSMRVF